ncbi:MAG: tail fiber domain-containing protein [Planctomycetota bacterium]
MHSTIRILIAIMTIAATASASGAQQIQANPTPFTYQGRLDFNGAPFTGVADFEFQLFREITGSSPVVRIDKNGVDVVDGLFSVDLAFSPSAYSFGPMYLEIAAGPAGGALETLSPRQSLSAAPFTNTSSGLRAVRGAVFVQDVDRTEAIAEADGKASVTLANGAWQSFTPDRSINVSEVDFDVLPGAAPLVTVSIREGEGPDGPQVLGGLAPPSFQPPLDEIKTVTSIIQPGNALVAGQTYTLVLDGNASYATVPDAYSGGRSGFSRSTDLVFRIRGETLGRARAEVDSNARYTGSAFRVLSGEGFVGPGDISIFKTFPSLILLSQDGTPSSIRLWAENDAGERATDWRVTADDQTLRLESDTTNSAQPPVPIATVGPNASSIGFGIGGGLPLVPVHVQPGQLGVGSASLFQDDLMVEDSDATIGLYSNSNGSFGSGISLGEVVSGTLASKWAIVRETAFVGNDLDFRFGTSPQHTVNPVRMQVRDTGDLWIQGQLFQNSSAALKEDVHEIRDAIDTLLKLRGVEYTWKRDGSADLGFIAEEMAEVLPQIVDFGEDGAPLAIDYGRVTALIVEATRELHDRVERQDEMIQVLMRRLETLEAEVSDASRKQKH